MGNLTLDEQLSKVLAELSACNKERDRLHARLEEANHNLTSVAEQYAKERDWKSRIEKKPAKPAETKSPNSSLKIFRGAGSGGTL